jgi:polyisoprenoid-binding protein YceI
MPYSVPVQHGWFFLAAVVLAPCIGSAQIPTFEVIVPDSKVNFHVNASVELTGVFDKWASTLKFTTPHVESGILEILVQAASVNTGSGLKDGKLKGSDFFSVKENPEIKFVSTKITNTALDSYRVDGNFTIRGMTNPESLTLSYQPEHPDEGHIRGQMIFDRKQYGMTHSIPLIKIADRVEVGVDLKIHRTSGPRPIQSKQ